MHFAAPQIVGPKPAAHPLQHCKDASHLCAGQVLVEQLRHMCLEEKVGRDGAAGKGYNALTQSAKEWSLEPAKPCSGERLLLMFDRW